MSVIIRLQNLPWSANALDIRQFFKGLSIPEGGVHIVGGEMGDAFIAFSTDEDARQAMMHDREKINEVQVRLLLSSRAEMQKVIETARQQSLQALQNANVIAATTKVTTLPTPQPPVITANSLQNILSSAAPSFLTYQQQAGIILSAEKTPLEKMESTSSRHNSTEGVRDKRRSNSRERERRRSRSRDRDRERDRDRDRDRERNDRNNSRRRRDRSRSRSRERDWKNRRSSRRSRSRDRSRERSFEHGRNTNRTKGTSKEKDSGPAKVSKDNNLIRNNEQNENIKPKTSEISSWNLGAVNAYQTNLNSDANTASNSPKPFSSLTSGNSIVNPFSLGGAIPGMRVTPNSYTSTSNSEQTLPNLKSTAPAFQNYSTSSSTTNNYSINFFGSSNSNSSDSIKAFPLQNPYTAAATKPALTDANSQDSIAPTALGMGTNALQQNKPMFAGLSLMDKPTLMDAKLPQTIITSTPIEQEPIAFANTNPYAQMYPNLFAQAAAASVASLTKSVNNASQQKTQMEEDHGNMQEERKLDDSLKESCSMKVTNMCGSATYSDLRKLFAPIFIPHNGIKMVNDKHGLRIGVAYIQFSRPTIIPKAILRNNSMLRSKPIKLEVVPDEEFENAEDSYRPQGRFDRNNERGVYGNRNDMDRDKQEFDVNSNRDGFSQERFERNNPSMDERRNEPFNVIYIEDIPSLATEQDIMKMFSSFTIYDILLTPSPENRREYIAHVRFSREEEAKAAFDDKTRHMIGYRKVRVRPGNIEDMEKAKEKVRLANEQLLKEEQAMAEEEARNAENEQADDDVMDIVDDGSNGPDDEEHQRNMQSMLPGNSSSGMMLTDRAQNANFSNIFEQPFVPSDPRLRQRPSRFDSGPSPLQQQKLLLSQQKQHQFMNNNMNRFNNADNVNMNLNLNMNDMSMKSQAAPPPPPFFNVNLNAKDLFSPINDISNNFVILKNCEYNTRINNIADMLMSSNFRLKHIEPLCNDRNMPTGEFIVEFQDSNDAEKAVQEFNNTLFRRRNLRVRPITPQEIADRLGKPFMNCIPGGGGGGNNNSSGNNITSMLNLDGPGIGIGGMRNNAGNNNPFDVPLARLGLNLGPTLSLGLGMNTNNLPDFRNNGGRFKGGNNNNMNNNNNNNNNSSHFNIGRGGRNNNSGGSRNRRRGGAGPNSGGSGGNLNRDRHQLDHDDDADDADEVHDKLSTSGNSNSDADAGIPEKFNRPGCVVAMENVPFKADLKDILKFFSGFELTPDDIIRRFNDDGTATGDARVAFSTPAVARNAFESRKRKQIFNRTIHLNLL